MVEGRGSNTTFNRPMVWPLGTIFGQAAQPESKGIKAKLSNSCRGEVARKVKAFIAKRNVVKAGE